MIFTRLILPLFTIALGSWAWAVAIKHGNTVDIIIVTAIFLFDVIYSSLVIDKWFFDRESLKK